MIPGGIYQYVHFGKVAWLGGELKMEQLQDNATLKPTSGQ
jgi:hypothetical protein